MFDLRGKFQKKLKSLGPRRNRKNEKKWTYTEEDIKYCAREREGQK